MREIAKPTPGDDEVLIKVFATTVNGADTRIRGAVFPSIFKLLARLAMGFTGPRRKILGVELAGQIEVVGKDVTLFKEGDEIFASSGMGFGTYAEYICLREKAVMALKPANMTYKEAAAVPHCALAALHYLRKGDVQDRRKVLIYGASGGIGTFAVQIAKAFGAEVTGVCSTANLELVRSLGADNVIDYTKEGLDQGGETYDVIFDTVGKSPMSACAKSLNKKGLYLLAVNLELSRILRGLWISMTSRKRVIGGVAAFRIEDLCFLKELIESGKMKTIIDRCYPFERMVEAHEYVDSGHKKGHVALTVDHKNRT